jgi:hypothetical protein
MGTIIDSLVVTLGLDDSGYKKGKAEAEAAQKSLKESALADAKATEGAGKKTGQVVSGLGKKRKNEAEAERKRRLLSEKDLKQGNTLEKRFTEGAISRLKTLALSAGGAVLGFKTLEGAIQAYAATSANLANLGRLAPTVGATAGGLNILGNAYRQVGGTQADATADVSKIARAQFSWQMHQPDQFASMARNLGVSLFTDKGQLRDKVAILTDIGKRLKAMTPDVQAQAMYARQMGLSEASIQLFIVDQARVRKQILADAIRTNAVTKQGVDLAMDTSTQWGKFRNRMQGAKDKVVQGTEANWDTALHIANSPNATLGDKIMGFIVGAVGGWTPADALGVKAGAPAKYQAAFAAADKKYGLKPGTLEAIAQRESNFNPNAVSKKGARGIMQLEPRFFPGAGKDPIADINTAGAEFARLLKVYGGNPALALAAYNAGQGTVDKYRSGIIKRLPAETRAYVPSVLNHMAGASAAAAMASGAAAAPARAATTATAPPTASNGTTVEIDNINVYTQATDANGIASALPEALRRKGVVAPANTGLS